MNIKVSLLAIIWGMASCVSAKNFRIYGIKDTADYHTLGKAGKSFVKETGTAESYSTALTHRWDGGLFLNATFPDYAIVQQDGEKKGTIFFDFRQKILDGGYEWKRAEFVSDKIIASTPKFSLVRKWIPDCFRVEFINAESDYTVNGVTSLAELLGEIKGEEPEAATARRLSPKRTREIMERNAFLAAFFNGSYGNKKLDELKERFRYLINNQSYFINQLYKNRSSLRPLETGSFLSGLEKTSSLAELNRFIGESIIPSYFSMHDLCDYVYESNLLATLEIIVDVDDPGSLKIVTNFQDELNELLFIFSRDANTFSYVLNQFCAKHGISEDFKKQETLRNKVYWALKEAIPVHSGGARAFVDGV